MLNQIKEETAFSPATDKGPEHDRTQGIRQQVYLSKLPSTFGPEGVSHWIEEPDDPDVDRTKTPSCMTIDPEIKAKQAETARLYGAWMLKVNSLIPSRD